MKFFILAVLLTSPALARADFTYKCKSDADKVTADLRMDDRGREGDLGLDYWADYPPQGLIYGDLKNPKADGTRVIYGSELDAQSGNKAEVALPQDFLTLDYFAVEVKVIGKLTRTYYLGCSRF